MPAQGKEGEAWLFAEDWQTLELHVEFLFGTSLGKAGQVEIFYIHMWILLLYSLWNSYYPLY